MSKSSRFILKQGLRKGHLVFLAVVLSLAGCTGKPDGVTPVGNFELERYLGTWYEIARMDHSFERGLSHVSANYSLRDDGGVKVLNRGYSGEDGEWQEAEGKAYFVENENTGYLKVSFFGPFYGSYIIFGLDRESYQYTFVSGPDTSYLWLLARSPTVTEDVRQRFLDKAQAAGFDTSKLIWVDQQ
jgi:apolipoprotein D and lipocalin family protein